jgi:hypothetical protein
LEEQFFKYIMASISYISMFNVGGLPETVAFNSLRLKLYLFIIQWTFISSFSLINIFLFDKMDLEVMAILISDQINIDVQFGFSQVCCLINKYNLSRNELKATVSGKPPTLNIEM